MKLDKLKQKIQEFAQEVSEHTFNDSRTVIAFTDFTFTVVTGSWEAKACMGYFSRGMYRRKSIRGFTARL